VQHRDQAEAEELAELGAALLTAQGVHFSFGQRLAIGDNGQHIQGRLG
jgi:hypothetical protein